MGFEYAEHPNKCEPPPGAGWRLHSVYNFHDGVGDRQQVTTFFVWEREVVTETAEQAHARGVREAMAGEGLAPFFAAIEACDWCKEGAPEWRVDEDNGDAPDWDAHEAVFVARWPVGEFWVTVWIYPNRADRRARITAEDYDETFNTAPEVLASLNYLAGPIGFDIKVPS